MLELGIKSLLAYLLGSVLGSLILGWLRGGVDIRTMGSGNAGGTNALRTQGVWFASWVMTIDVGKGFVATAWIPWLQLVPIDVGIDHDWLTIACALSSVIGHVYPVWYRFQGGKGIATLVGVVIGLKFSAVLPLLGLWLLVLIITGFVGLASIVAVAGFPLYLILKGTESTALMSFAWVMVAFVCYTHRKNIQRMLLGTESRIQRIWIFRPR